MAPCTHPGIKRLFCLKAKNGLIIITSREVNEARGGLVLAVGRVRSKKKQNRKIKKQEKIHPTQNTPRKPQQPGERDPLETAREKTRPTR